MKNAKTLLVLSPGFPKNESETSWLPSQQLLVKNLKEQFPQLNILVVSFFYPYEKKTYQWNGIDIIAFGGMDKRKLNRIRLWMDIWKQLKKLHQQNELIGLLSFWCHECALIGKWFAHRYKLKHFCWICGQDASGTNKYARWIRPGPGELIAISDFIREEFKKNHKIEPKHTIPNAIDVRSFRDAFTSERDIDILGAGGLIPLKQYDVFTDIVAGLQQSFPFVNAIHCGRGEEKENIHALIRKHGLDNNFKLLGATSHEELLGLMQRTKVFLHTSRYEGFSTVCLEALYAGAHVISFVRPMHREIKNWHIVKTREEMLAKAFDLLAAKDLQYERVPVYFMRDSAKQIMLLFDKHAV
jgi:glycosyltransferase involved in cell wall biosynthesis